MAIPMLDMKSAWGKVKAGWSGGNKFRSLAKNPGHTFVDGVEAGAKESQMRNPSPQLPAFGGGGKKK